MKKLLSAALAAGMILSLAACGNEPAANNNSKEESKATSKENSSTTSEVSTEKSGNPWDNTTYHTFTSGTPKTWNPLEWEGADDSYIMNMITSSFWNFKVNDAGDNFEVYCDAAAKLPEDISAEYAGKGEWGIPADAKNGDGWAYKITLRDDLCWEDGTPIHAVDFVESTKRLLDPEMKNYRASDTYDGTVTFVNAKNYYWHGERDTEIVEWDQVGLKATGENELTYILSKPVNMFYMLYNGGLPLVKTDMYDSLLEKTGDITKSKYCTSLDTTISWGQFKLVEFQEDKLMRVEKNDKWYGWNDPNYEGRYWFSNDAEECQIIKEHATALQMFLQGKLDSIGLNNDDMETYGSSDYLHLQPGTFTYRFSFNTDYDKLKSLETEGICKRMPTYVEFRKAFSRAMNRKEYCATCTACNVPAYGLFNRLYIADPATGTIYRDTPRAEQAILNVYGDGTGDVNAITGYNLEEARDLFQQAYEKAKAAGDYKDGDIVEVNFMLYKDNEHYQKIVNHIDDKIQEATKGTGLEGHIKIRLTPDEDYYNKASTGDYEVVMVSLGGASMNTPVLLQWYCEEEGGKNEYGFHPSKEEFTATVEGKEYTMTYQKWAEELTDGMWANADPMLRAEILAIIEEQILLQYRTIPMFYGMSGTLLSHRVSYESDEYLPMVGFGKTTISMNDAEWEAYIKENNGHLDY